MTAIPLDFIDSGDGVSPLGHRIAGWVRRLGSAKVVAREFGVAVKTAESWRAGNLPQMRHFAAMVDRWGEAFLLDVFEPVLEADALLDRRLERLQNEISSIREEIVADETNQSRMGAFVGEAARLGGRVARQTSKAVAEAGRCAVARPARSLFVGAIAASALTAPAAAQTMDDADDWRMTRTVRVRPSSGSQGGRGQQ